MKKQEIIILAVVILIAAVYLKLIPYELASTGSQLCPGKPVTFEEWTFPSLWTTKPPECIANPNGNAIIYPIVEIKDRATGSIIYTWAGGTKSVPCAYGVKIGTFTFNVPTTSSGYLDVAGRYANTYGVVFHSYTTVYDWSASGTGCQTCTVGQHKCVNDYLLTCTADGVYNIGGQVCQFGCNDPGNGQAYCTAKQPNYKHCIDNKTYEQYSADGTQIVQTVGCDLLYTCVEGQGCVKGSNGCYGDADCGTCFTHCISSQCQLTGTQPQKPCANAYWQAYPTCNWNTHDCSNYTESCGNGFCGTGENYTTCPVDCKAPPSPTPDWMIGVLALGGIVIVGGILLLLMKKK